MENKKLQWKTKHQTDFSKEANFLETILIDNGVEEDSIKDFLRPTKKFVNDPFLLKNMDKAIELVRKHMMSNSKVFVRVDCDTDGFSSSAALIQFLREVNPNIEIDYLLNYEKRHGLSFNDLENHTKDEYGLIIIPDASMEVKEARMIKKNFSADILVLDHHIIENEFYDKVTKKWITRDEAKELYAQDKDRIEVDCYTNYCLPVNCTVEPYPNPRISGVGVVQKFIEAYMDKYEEVDNLDSSLREKFLDLVSLGINADSIDLRSLESRYYVLEGMKERNCNNEFLTELVARNEEDAKWGRNITFMSWTIAPRINGCVRYGKPDEQVDTFRAMLGEQEDIEYQPRRKSKYDPAPPVEIHSLQKTMARVCDNIKSRQDTEVRKFVTDLDKEIQKEKLYNNSVIFIDGTKVLTKNTVTGLVANKLASKYFRPVVLLKTRDSLEYGGSMRGYDKGVLENTKTFLEQAGLTVMGHPHAAGIRLQKAKLQEAIEKCNEMLPVESLTTVHTVDWEIPATKLKREYVQEVAENYGVFGSTVPTPMFVITDLEINASQIMSYGENATFIRFVYNGITFVKKYCSHDDFDNMTLKGRSGLGVNKKNLRLNLICQFALNVWEDKVVPQVVILDFDSEEVKNDQPNKSNILLGKSTSKNGEKTRKTEKNGDDDWDFEERPIKSKKSDDLDFDW